MDHTAQPCGIIINICLFQNVTLPAVPVVVDAAIYEAVLGKAPGSKLHVIYGLI